MSDIQLLNHPGKWLIDCYNGVLKPLSTLFLEYCTGHATWSFFDSVPHNPDLMTLKTFFENIVGKGENAGDQHFLFFPQCFLPSQRQK